jgi:hypothetical protein
MKEQTTKTAREIDQVICNWTMDNGVSLTESQLNNLVDELCELFNIDAKEGLN